MTLQERWRGLWKKEERWSLSCDYHNWAVHDLSESEARVILETLRDIEKATLLVWRTGWQQWRNLRDAECARLLNTRIVRLQAPPLPHQEDYDPEITAVRPVTAANPFASRKFTRFEVKYPIILMSGTQEFKTEALDLSEGGLKVRDPLPDWVAGYCAVVIQVEDGQKIEVMCSLAEDQKHQKSRLEIVESDKYEEFLNWFRAHPKFQTPE